MQFNFSSINLWCNKNLVDLEFIIWEILKFSSEHEINYYEDPEDELTEFVIINTCWFLSTSRQEAENTIKYYDELWKKIILVWCYIQVADSDFLSSLNNLYKIVPFLNYSAVFEILGIKPSINYKISTEQNISSNTINLSNLKDRKLEEFITEIKDKQIWNRAFIWNWDEVRAYLNAPYGYEYLKIAEWCDNNCTFCIIPKIRWKQQSRTIEQIIIEAKIMISSWIREIILIAQDTTRYWVDNYGEPKLIELLQELEKLDWDFKYRVLYMYPDNLTLSHLEKLKTFKKFIPYFDIPFQHISEKILKLMWRYYDTTNIFEFLDFIRDNFKTYYLRTAFIIGFPWEDETDYRTLYNFIEKYKFDSVALFEYHDEPLAASSKMSDKVDSKTSVSRIKKLDKLINKIYEEKTISDKWKIFNWYIEWIDGKEYLIRREIRAPEIDELDTVNKKQILTKWQLDIGSFVEFKV